MSWDQDREDRRDFIRSMTTSELIHLMISNFDGDKESSGPGCQNFDFFWAADELDRRFPVAERHDNGNE